MERDNRPVDIKLVEKGKKLKLLEAGAGLAIGIVNPIAGGVILGGLQLDGWVRIVTLR